VACKKILEPFLPTPVVIIKADGTLGFDYDCPKSIGRVRMSFVQTIAVILSGESAQVVLG
jgi:glycine cleavage system protein P-like pyridoxal-binding family